MWIIMSFDMCTPLSLSSHEKPKTVSHLIFYLGDRMEYNGIYDGR